jgi:hypothetical protein
VLPDSNIYLSGRPFDRKYLSETGGTKIRKQLEQKANDNGNDGKSRKALYKEDFCPKTVK